MSAYYTTHTRLWKKRGKASEHFCASDHNTDGHHAQEWAYNGLADEEKTGYIRSGTKNRDGDYAYTYSAKYSDDINDYVPLCRAEHIRLDAIHANPGHNIYDEDETGFWLL